MLSTTSLGLQQLSTLGYDPCTFGTVQCTTPLFYDPILWITGPNAKVEAIEFLESHTLLQHSFTILR